MASNSRRPPLYTNPEAASSRRARQDPEHLDYHSEDSEEAEMAVSALSQPQPIQPRSKEPWANRLTIPSTGFGGAPRLAHPRSTPTSDSNYNSAAPTSSPFHSNHFPSPTESTASLDSSRQTAQNLSVLKYCYRHRPDLQTRRQADIPSMEQLQNELSTMSQNDRQGISTVWALFESAPTKHRELMLQGILNQCCFPQLSMISASVRELLKIDFLTALPAELGYHILSFLDPVSLCRAAQVNHHWRSFADDDVVWHGMCEQHIDTKCKKCGWGLPLLERQKVQAEQRQIHLHRSTQNLRQTSPGPSRLSQEIEASAYSSDDAEHSEANVTVKTKGNGKKRTITAALSPPGDSIKRVCTPTHNYATDELYFQPSYRPWKEVYRDRFRIGSNWKYGRCTIKTLKGHTDGVMCLQFDDNILASGSYDSTIKIWDIETGEELRTLTGHTLGVRCLQFDKTKLVSGSLDGTLKMWDLKNGRILRTFPGHSGAVISLHFDGSILASGSQDKTIRARDFKNCQRIVLRGHTDWVNAVKVDSASQTLYSASDDCTVRMWDLAAKRCVRVFDQHVGQVQTVLPLPRDFELDPGDMNFLPDRSENNTTAHMNRLQITDDDVERPDPPKYMLTGGLDSTIRLWEVSTGRCVRTFFGHVEGIWAVAVDALRMVSGANDGMVKVWDPRTGRCERTFTGHSGPVTCVALSDRRMVTGSEDREIRVYNFEGSNEVPDESQEGAMAIETYSGSSSTSDEE